MNFKMSRIGVSLFFCIHLIMGKELLFLASANPTPTTTIGFTYSPSANSPPPESVVTALESSQISSVRLLNPNQAIMKAFTNSKISLLLTVQNNLVRAFASNPYYAQLWVSKNVLPYYPSARISLISVGSDVRTTDDTLLHAMKNLYISLLQVGIRNISVSTTFSFTHVITTAFPPSHAKFHNPDIMSRLLMFLNHTESSLLMNIYPFDLYESNIPIAFALCQYNDLNVHYDQVTGAFYFNLFEMMVDSAITSMAILGYDNIPIVVAETGWPCSSKYRGSEMYPVAGMYLDGLVSLLKSGRGTPLRREGVKEAYIYKLFDDESNKGHYNWGVMHPNLTIKYPNINFGTADYPYQMTTFGRLSFPPVHDPSFLGAELHGAKWCQLNPLCAKFYQFYVVGF